MSAAEAEQMATGYHQAHPPAPAPPNAAQFEPEDEDEWEYEYSTTETEVRLDVLPRSPASIAA